MKSSRAGAGRATFFYVFAAWLRKAAMRSPTWRTWSRATIRIVVAKLGVAGQTAIKLDPRSRDWSA
jgi:hypothetical protein